MDVSFAGWNRYQTGALAPLIRWLSQGMQRAAAPLQPPRPGVRADNAHAPGRAGHENDPAAGKICKLDTMWSIKKKIDTDKNLSSTSILTVQNYVQRPKIWVLDS